MRLKSTIIYFTTILFANAMTVKSEDIHRNGRILWPSPVQKNETNFDKHSIDINKTVESETDRQKRYILSYKHNMMAEKMFKILPPEYIPHNTNDPFDFLRDSYPLPKGYSKPLDEYDYIIIGGGTAGSVLAARLTEDKPRAMVLLIEAGKPEHLLNDVPALVSYMQLTDAVWPYTMEKQEGICLGSENQQCYWPRGKALGGTSVINYMLYTRGRPQDWNRIAADGNYGWSYDEVLQYYIKSERSELEKYRNLPYRGRDGEMSVSNIPFKTGLVEAFLKAERSFGHPTVDYNSPYETGFGYIQAMIHKGHRVSAAKAFLHNHKRRPNLHILTDTRATKILTHAETKRTYAVEYVKNGVKHTVRCRREVILSAGPIASPQLLMLSGIGPKDHLESHNIPVIANVPVGKVLYDHIAFPGVIFRLNTTNASLLESKVATFPNVLQWMHYGDGLLTTPGGVEALGYLKTSASDDVENVPDIELLSMGASWTLDSGGALRESFRFSEQMFHQMYQPLYNRDTWSAIIMLTQPKSRGYLELRDTNPFSHPKMYGNYLTEPQDMAAFVEAIKHVIQVGNSEAFRKYDPKLYLTDIPTCRNHVPASESYWTCAVRTLMVTLHHQIATCRMGPPTDPLAVVDPELRVYGVKGLRVADSSVIPRPINAHTAAPAVMIGEKAADMIKKTWSNDAAYL